MFNKLKVIFIFIVFFHSTIYSIDSIHHEPRFVNLLRECEKQYNQMITLDIKQPTSTIIEKLFVFLRDIEKLEAAKKEMTSNQLQEYEARVAYFECAKKAFQNDFAIYKKDKNEQGNKESKKIRETRSQAANILLLNQIQNLPKDLQILIFKYLF